MRLLRLSVSATRTGLALGLALLSGIAAAAPAPSISWEVNNRFPLYKKVEDFRHYLDAANDVAKERLGAGQTGDWVLETEHTLQGLADARGWAAKDFNVAKFNEEVVACGVSPTARCVTIQSLAPDYVQPKSHDILASVENVATIAGAACTWTLSFSNAPPTLIFGACSNQKITIPFTAPEDADAPRLSVIVRPAGGAEIDIAPIPVRVRDYLIVGVGDSFAAGVGSPDAPVTMDRNPHHTLGSINGGFHGPIYSPWGDPAYAQELALPLRADGGPQYLNVFCHRSQYGLQFRAALHLAVASPHSAVTFLDYSCTGARVLEGLLSRFKLDAGYAAQAQYEPAQIAEVARGLCKSPMKDVFERRIKYVARSATSCEAGALFCDYDDPTTGAPKGAFRNDPALHDGSRVALKGCGESSAVRPIDYLLLSIGGNDIGFAPLIANEALASGTGDFDAIRNVLKSTGGDIEPPEVGMARLDLLPAKYEQLQAAIDAVLPMRGADSSRVLLSAYPLADRGDDDSRVCGDTIESAKRADASMNGLNYLGAFADDLGDRPKADLARSTHDTACALDVRRSYWMNGADDVNGASAVEWMKASACAGAPTDASGQAALKWSYVSSFAREFWPHSFCATTYCDPDAGCPRERLEMPGVSGWMWKPYEIGRYRPYASRSRWMRTFNDAYLIVNWQANSGRPGSLANAIAAFATDALHPSAEGAAAIADTLFCALANGLKRRGELDDGASDALKLCP